MSAGGVGELELSEHAVHSFLELGNRIVSGDVTRLAASGAFVRGQSWRKRGVTAPVIIGGARMRASGPV